MTRWAPDDLPGWVTRALPLVVAVVLVVGLVLLAAEPEHGKLSQSQLREFGPVCASDGRIDTVREVRRVGGRVLYRVHCSGGLTTELTEPAP